MLGLHNMLLWVYIGIWNTKQNGDSLKMLLFTYSFSYGTRLFIYTNKPFTHCYSNQFLIFRSLAIFGVYFSRSAGFASVVRYEMCAASGPFIVSMPFDYVRIIRSCSLHAFICKKAAIIWDEGTISCSPTKYKTFMCVCVSVYFFKIFSYSVTNHTTTKHIRTELSNSRSIQNRISNYAHSVLHQNCMQISQ